jgi:hypothetical protein
LNMAFYTMNSKLKTTQEDTLQKLVRNRRNFLILPRSTG